MAIRSTSEANWEKFRANWLNGLPGTWPLVMGATELPIWVECFSNWNGVNQIFISDHFLWSSHKIHLIIYGLNQSSYEY
jgi:hypothetical protein